MRKRKTGKLPWNTLLRLLQLVPTSDIDVIMGPGVGEDAAIIRLRDGFLVVHTDPITAASRRIGWLSIHIAANDIAVRGAKPKWFTTTVLIPDNYEENDIETIFRDIGIALRELDAVSIGGHTEITPGIPRPILVTTAIGYTQGRVILTRDAKPGDYLVVVGRVGGEGVGVIAWDFEEKLLEKGISKDVIDEAKKFLNEISVVEKALVLKDYVNSMHDPTEGGLIQGLREIALACNCEALLELDKIKLDPIVEEVARAMDINPLKLLSSGSLIASIPEHKIRDATKILDEKGYYYAVVGQLREGVSGRIVITHGGQVVEVVDKDVVDEIYKLWD
ncbi:MAG: AIR synthase family protein [Thermoprotei archaeon]